MKNHPDDLGDDTRQNEPDDRRPGTPPQPGAEPAQPVMPGGGEADAVRGRATKSPADVGTRDHLRGAAQGPK